MKSLTIIAIVVAVAQSLLYGISVAQNVQVPFVVPSRAAVVAGIPNMRSVEQLLVPYQSQIQDLLPLLLCTDLHSGEEVQVPWIKEAKHNLPGNDQLKGLSIWLVMDESADEVGEMAIVILHPNLSLSGDQQRIFTDFVHSIFSFLPKMISKNGGTEQAKLSEKLFQWEQNHSLAFETGATVVSSSRDFAKKLKVDASGDFVIEQFNRSFGDAAKFAYSDSDLVFYLSPANAKALALLAGFEKMNTLKTSGYRYQERPWVMFSAKIEEDKKKIDYKCIARTTLPYSKRDVVWTAYKEIAWIPKFSGRINGVSAVHKDLEIFEKIFVQFDPDLALVVRNSPLLSWEWGLGRANIGGLHVGYRFEQDIQVDLKFLRSEANSEEVVKTFDNYYSKYSEETMRLGRDNFFEGDLIRKKLNGFPAWGSQAEMANPPIAVLTNESVYEGPTSIFDQIERTLDGKQAHDSELIQSLKKIVRENGVEGSIVQISIDHNSKVSRLLAFYLNQYVLSFFQEHTYQSEAQLLEMSNFTDEKTKQTRYQMLVVEMAKFFYFLRSNKVKHTEVCLFDIDSPLWKVVGRFELSESTDGKK